jgi:hypothetical protein
MIFKKLKLSILLLSLGLTAQAQQAIVASGGTASGNGGTVNYSIGQVVYTTATGLNGSVAQGVQQTYEITAVTGIEEGKGIRLEVSAYPNPTTDLLTLDLGASTSLNDQPMSYKLYDMNGKIVETQKIVDENTTIVMSNLLPANYFLTVVKTMDGKSSQEVKTFKITKN